MGIFYALPSAQRDAFQRAYSSNPELVKRLNSVGIGRSNLYAIHRVFVAMDTDSSGEISLVEFFDYVDIKMNRFTKKAFSVMDTDGSGEIDFIEFVLALWNYCSFTHPALVRFAFDLYDLDGSGSIDRSEAGCCIREIWGSSWETSSSAKKVHSKLEMLIDNSTSGTISAPAFQEFVVRHPILLFPAFQLQYELQQRILGHRYWRRVAKKRGKWSPQQLLKGQVAKILSPSAPDEPPMPQFSRQASELFLTACEDELHFQPKTSTGKKRGSRTGSNERVVMDINEETPTLVVPLTRTPSTGVKKHTKAQRASTRTLAHDLEIEDM